MNHISRINKSKYLLRVSCYVLRDEAGQTLIETIIAIFILTMALTSGLGLAIYAFSAANTAQNQIVATSLAREGVEVVRLMRDSNWLAGDASADASFNLTACANIGGKSCYPKAFVGPSYNFTTTGNRRVNFNSTNNTWSIDSTADYNLYPQADGSYTNNPLGTSTFARMLKFSFNSNPPFVAGNEELIVSSVVAWRGKNCPAFASSADLLSLSTSCRVVVEEHLTNWKDYK